jgi:hypothetical protein
MLTRSFNRRAVRGAATTQDRSASSGKRRLPDRKRLCDPCAPTRTRLLVALIARGVLPTVVITSFARVPTDASFNAFSKSS